MVLEKPQEVPNRLTTKIDYRVFVLLFGLVVGLQTYLSFATEENADLMGTGVSLANPLAASAIGFYVARKYSNSLVFGKSYLVLALGLLSMGLGEATYAFYDLVLEEDPYPSIADVFFFGFYPLAFYHIFKNVRFFQAKIGNLTKALIVILPISIVGIYSSLSFQQIGEFNFDYFYGLIFISSSAVVLTAAILGARVFRQGMLGVAWLVLLIGILLTTIGDVWYYYMETFEQYTLIHPVNLFWYASYWVIFYALYKHQKII
jgi:hypothetical protein